MTRPDPSEYATFYAGYVGRVPETDVLGALAGQEAALRALLAPVTAERESFRYAEGKWSFRQMAGHLVDAERVFGYRAFCISRKDPSPLPGFDENAYVDHSPYQGVPLTELLAEWSGVRQANLTLLRRLRPEQWSQTGTAWGHGVSVRALAYIMVGHARHHMAVLAERYGLGAGS